MARSSKRSIPQHIEPSPPADPGNLVGTDHVGDDDRMQLPEDHVGIKLPIEEGDFSAQPS